MKTWKKSTLVMGEELQISKELFIEGDKAKERLISCKYIGETDAGIFVECKFRPTVSLKEKSYKIMINWPSIFCGHVKVIREDGSMVQAVRENSKEVLSYGEQ